MQSNRPRALPLISPQSPRLVASVFLPRFARRGPLCGRRNEYKTRVPGRIAVLCRVVTRVCCLAILLVLPDRAVAQQTTALTAMDYIEIQQLVNRLNFALDYCTSGGRAFADLFVEGGQFIIDQGDGKTTVRRTRDELIALAGGPDCASRKSPPSSYILHLAESLVIEPAADGARGKSYAIYPASKGRYYDAGTAGQLGIYHDEYVKTPEGWRIRSRRHEVNPSPAG